ncbi:glycosyltransferase family 4 protein [Halosimplex salinum]|uniref:glycosyltransferase family 4 protein n=1 Tax=Halosimplex salinum TaxID=1710538 RepID=UPI000F46E072|nr:glycosyltransferase family 4 protein [Halosimplex salinum]
MKIAFVYDAVFPWEKGGAQKRVWELARRLAEDHDVHLYGMHYWDGPAVMERDGITYHGVCEPYDLYTDGRRAIPPAVKFAASLGPELVGTEYDIVDCQQFPYFPVLASKLQELTADTSLVVTWYEVWDDYWYDYLGWKGVFGKAIEQMTMRTPETIVPISSFIRDDLVEAGGSREMTVVENGVDYQGIQEIPAADEDWDVVYVGRLAEHKNVAWLLEAVEAAEDRLGRPVETCIVGDGPERERLEGIAAERDLENVVFQGFVEEDEDVIGHVKAADVFVLPSIREGFPNTILEANACGVPSLVVDHPENGSTAVVQDGRTGFVVDPDPAAITDQIAEVLTDDVLLSAVSAGAREYGAAHDWDEIVADLEDVYRAVRPRRRRVA